MKTVKNKLVNPAAFIYKEYCLKIPKMLTSITLGILVLCFVSTSFAQGPEDTTDKRFHDDLLDHLVGKWEVSATVHGQKFTLDREAGWVLNHQYLRIHEKSREVIPWLKVPFERTIFIGYNHRTKRYVVHELNVHGADIPAEPEGFSYAARAGNELAMDHMMGTEVVGRSRWSWDPASGSWHFQGGQVIDGKEQEPHAHLRAIRAKTSSK